MAAVVVAVLQIIARAAAAGTLDEIAATALKLIGLLLPLLRDDHPEVTAGLVEIRDTIALRVRPATPEQPAMTHAAGRTTMGGR